MLEKNPLTASQTGPRECERLLEIVFQIPERADENVFHVSESPSHLQVEFTDIVESAKSGIMGTLTLELSRLKGKGLFASSSEVTPNVTWTRYGPLPLVLSFVNESPPGDELVMTSGSTTGGRLETEDKPGCIKKYLSSWSVVGSVPLLLPVYHAA